MIAAIKAEFKKLLTVRSTYLFLALVLGLEFLFAFYATGWKIEPAALAEPFYLSAQVTSALSFLVIFMGFVAVLLITHEYRYNTIMYTLTSKTSRTKVMLAKIIAITCFAVVFAIFFGFLSPALTILAVKLHGQQFHPQIFNIGSLLWRSAFYGWAFAMYASIIAFIIRAQIGALITLFIAPGVVENIAGLVIKKNQIYLPFSSLNTLMDMFTTEKHITNINAVVIALMYIGIGGAVSWFLFLKKDAS